jgi:hypothetical protein
MMLKPALASRITPSGEQFDAARESLQCASLGKNAACGSGLTIRERRLL